MKIDSDIQRKSRGTNWFITLVFIILGVSLFAMTMLYWNKVLEPRLKREAQSQANILAHSLAVRLAQVISSNQPGKLLPLLEETTNEVFLFADPQTSIPFLVGLDLDLDYEVIAAPVGSLNISKGERNCRECFLSTVALYSPASDELMGIARFRVNNAFFKDLSRDVKNTLMAQAQLVLVLLFIVWGLIMYLVKTINRSRYQAEIANRTKSAFLANMSHELRTPLNAIIGFSQLMRRDPDFSAEQKENLSIINRSGEYLLELINDVLELSKIEAAKSSVMEEVFDIHATLDSLEEMVRLRAEKKNIQLLVTRHESVPHYIKSDEKKLRQILLNLLGNAVKFTEKGQIVLRIGTENHKMVNEGDVFSLRFEIEDTGPGIPLTDRERLFEAFTQAEGGLRKQEGTGLGLSICRQFVRQLGGEINVESIAGKGSIFTFTIRVCAASATGVKPHETTRKVVGIKAKDTDTRNGQYRIVIVDDHHENRVLLRMLIEQVGFSVKEAENGLQAVEINEFWKPHLLWMDMRMPEMDGYEATRRIRERGSDQQPVVIALTASAFEEDRQKVLAAGCDDFVRRPFHEYEIFEKMRQHLGVEYVYESGPQSEGAKVKVNGISRESICRAILALPENRVKDLRSAAELSDMEKIDQVVAKISETDTNLAQVLKGYVESFQYDKILNLLDNETITSGGIKERTDE